MNYEFPLELTDLTKLTQAIVTAALFVVPAV